MHVALWVAQVLVALAFGMAGTMKTITPIEELLQKMPWFVAVPWLPRIIDLSRSPERSGLAGSRP